MAALLWDETPDATPVLEGIRNGALQSFRSFISRGIWTEAQADRLKADLDCCLSIDRFDFAMLVERRNGLLIMKAVS
jgi:hypothetical protein